MASSSPQTESTASATKVYRPGQFQPGHDARRFWSPRLIGGETLAALARKLTPECIELLGKVIRGEDYKVSDRLRAAELLLERGWGKAVSVVEMNVSHTQEIRELKREDLVALAAGLSPRLPITVDGEILDPSRIDEVDTVRVEQPAVPGCADGITTPNRIE